MTNPPSLTASELSAIPAIRHGFFTRAGGGSEGFYDSLNCGPGSMDDPASVAANRATVAGALGADHLVTAYQCHTNKALVIDAPFTGKAPEADALVTAIPGLALGVLAADCGPILFAAHDGSVIGAAHAGWKGALTGIIENTVVAMESLGAKRGAIGAALGPCIAQASYQVGPEFRDSFIKEGAAFDRFFAADGDKFRFDLGGFILMRLDQAGIARPGVLTLDTYPDAARFFSYRRAVHRHEADYGRQVSAIVIG